MIRGRAERREHRRLGDNVFQNIEQRNLRTRDFFVSFACAVAEVATICQNLEIGYVIFWPLRLIAKLVLQPSHIAVKKKIRWQPSMVSDSEEGKRLENIDKRSN